VIHTVSCTGPSACAGVVGEFGVDYPNCCFGSNFWSVLA
jgi:hypothetical protein